MLRKHDFQLGVNSFIKKEAPECPEMRQQPVELEGAERS